MNNDASSPEQVRPTIAPADPDLGGAPGAFGPCPSPAADLHHPDADHFLASRHPLCAGVVPRAAAGLRPFPGGDHHRRRGRGKERVAHLFPAPDPVAGGCGLVRRCAARSGGRLDDRRVCECPAGGGTAVAGPAGGLVVDFYRHADLPHQSAWAAPGRNLVGAGMRCPCCCAAIPRWWPAPCWA